MLHSSLVWISENIHIHSFSSFKQPHAETLGQTLWCPLINCVVILAPCPAAAPFSHQNGLCHQNGLPQTPPLRGSTIHRAVSRRQSYSFHHRQRESSLYRRRSWTKLSFKRHRCSLTNCRPKEVRRIISAHLWGRHQKPTCLSMQSVYVPDSCIETPALIVS